MPTISKQLALLFITMAWKMCIARIGSGEYDIGSGDASFDQIDTGKRDNMLLKQAVFVW